jgi:chromate reductase, NAD(P)H dehydrogenase (quinone)
MNNKIKVVAFAASNSSQSINRQLVSYAADLIENAAVEVLDLNDYEMPIYSHDREQQNGQPKQANLFIEKIAEADVLMISFAEHNGTYTAAYKNIFDWCSRIERKIYQDKPTLLLSTSPGGRGGASVLQQATESLPRFGAKVKATLAVPLFDQVFDSESKQVIDSEIKQGLVQGIKQLMG